MENGRPIGEHTVRGCVNCEVVACATYTDDHQLVSGEEIYGPDGWLQRKVDLRPTGRIATVLDRGWRRTGQRSQGGALVGEVTSTRRRPEGMLPGTDWPFRVVGHWSMGTRWGRTDCTCVLATANPPCTSSMTVKVGPVGA